MPSRWRKYVTEDEDLLFDDEAETTPVAKPEKKAKNYIAAKDVPDLFNGLQIDPRAIADNDYRGCIMVNTEIIPVVQFVENGQDDLVEAEKPEDHTMGAVAEVEPHTTLLFGLLNNGNIWKDKVDRLLEGWEMPQVTISEVSYFDVGDSYCIIGLLEKTPEIVDGHERLTLLPHVNTHSEYKPHITLAYIKKDADVEKWVGALSKKYTGQIVATKGINYGDAPVSADASNHVEDEHDASDLPKAEQATKKKTKCSCCEGAGEHTTGFECYRCDASGLEEGAQGSVPCSGREDSEELYKDDDGNWQHKSKNAAVSHVEGPRIHDCAEHDTTINSTMARVQNALEPAIKDSVVLQESNLYSAAQRLEAAMAIKYIQAVQNGNYDEAKDILLKSEEKGFRDELEVTLKAFFLVLYPIYAQQILAVRASEFGQQGVFAMTKDVEKAIKEQAKKAAESHIQTVKRDIQEAILTAVDAQTESAMVKLVQQEVDSRNQTYLGKLPKNPNIEDIVQAVKDGKFDSMEIYERARQLAREGDGLDAIVRQIKKEYETISKNRAKTIARHEANRVFNMAQYQADLQFLKESNLLDSAYKRLRSRTGDPCPICNELIEQTQKNPIPFTKNFADIGDELSATYTKANGKKAVQKMPITYEAIVVGNVHVNCQCEYELLVRNNDGTFLNFVEHVQANGVGYNPYRDSIGRFASGPGGARALSFTDKDYANDYINDNYSVDESNIKKEDRMAVMSYTGTYYREINNYLRHGKLHVDNLGPIEFGGKTIAGPDVDKINNRTIDYTKRIENLQSKFRLKDNLVLYRSANLKSPLRRGDTFVDKGFSSTTLIKKTATNFTVNSNPVKQVIMVKAQKGTNGIFPNTFNHELSEQEFILPRNTRYTVVSVQRKQKYDLVEAEISWI